MNLSEQIKKTVREVADFPRDGILFKDITPLFEDQKLCNGIVQGFIDALPFKPDAIVGVESRGFLFGFLLANKLNVPFVMVRKAGKLPSELIFEEYDLEYGSAKVEMQANSLKPGWKVVV